MKLGNKLAFLMAMAMLGWGGAQAAVEEVAPDEDLHASRQYAYTVTCWQEGVKLFEESGNGHYRVSKNFVTSSMEIIVPGEQEERTSVYIDGNTTCRLKTRPH